MHYFPFLGALAILQAELKPTADPVLSSPEYRRDLAVNLLYKVKSFFFLVTLFERQNEKGCLMDKLNTLFQI